MEESLDRQLKRAVRKNSSLAILMIDVDHFKSLNDTFGHEAGDAVLRSLGTLLKAQFRGEDIVCRYGGEEFTVILPEASIDVARQRSSALCEASADGNATRRTAATLDQPLHWDSCFRGTWDER